MINIKISLLISTLVKSLIDFSKYDFFIKISI